MHIIKTKYHTLKANQH